MTWIEHLGRDLRFGLRALSHQAGLCGGLLRRAEAQRDDVRRQFIFEE
jgi:hypothetical protein